METTTVILLVVVIFILLVLFVLVSYVKAPPSYAYIISGISREPRVLIGSGGIRVPFFERLDKVYLGQICRRSGQDTRHTQPRGHTTGCQELPEHDTAHDCRSAERLAAG